MSYKFYGYCFKYYDYYYYFNVNAAIVFDENEKQKKIHQNCEDFGKILAYWRTFAQIYSHCEWRMVNSW